MEVLCSLTEQESLYSDHVELYRSLGQDPVPREKFIEFYRDHLESLRNLQKDTAILYDRLGMTWDIDLRMRTPQFRPKGWSQDRFEAAVANLRRWQVDEEWTAEQHEVGAALSAAIRAADSM